jgi:hypothetical protein
MTNLIVATAHLMTLILTMRNLAGKRRRSAVS